MPDRGSGPADTADHWVVGARRLAAGSPAEAGPGPAPGMPVAEDRPVGVHGCGRPVAADAAVEHFSSHRLQQNSFVKNRTKEHSTIDSEVQRAKANRYRTASHTCVVEVGRFDVARVARRFVDDVSLYNAQ